MLSAIKGLLTDRRDRQEMLNLRATMASIHTAIFPENEITGAIVRMKTGLRLEQQLETRLGTMGPDFLNPVTTDYDLEREGEIFDRLPPERLAQLATGLERLVQRVPLERGAPETWEDGEDTKNVATIIALRLLSGWLKCKSIVHTSMNRKVIKEAQDLENLHYSHIRSLLRLFRGEKAIQEGEGAEEEATRPESGSGFHSAAEFVGAALLIQFLPEDRPLITDAELRRMTAGFDAKFRKTVELWIVLYVTWLMKVLAAQKFGDEFARSVMAAVYGRIAANEDRVPGIDSIGETIKYWFKQMDEGANDAVKNPTIVAGEPLPFFYLMGLRFLARDSGSPFCGKPNPVFNDLDMDVATALAEAQDLSKPRIDYTLEQASTMPR